MTAAQIRKLRRKIRRRRAIHRWRFILIILFLGVVGYAGHWAYGKILNRQAYALVSRAMEDWKEGKPVEARMGVETALRIQPGHPPATRLLARIQVASGEPVQALATFQKLTDERQLGLEDLKLYASLASQKGETQLADRLAKAVARNGDPAFPHLLKASALLRENKPAEAETELRAAVAADPNDTTRGALLDFLIKTRRPGQSVQEAAAIIQDFSTRDSALGAQALALGLRTGYMNPDKRGEWIEKLRAHPKVSTANRLLADSFAVAANPESKPQIAAELVEFVESKPLSDRTLAAQWLTKNGHPDLARSLLALDESLPQTAAFLAWLDATAATNQWSESLAALQRPDNPLPAHISKLFLGLTLKRLDQPAESRAALQEAIRGAGNDPAKFAEVTTYLLEMDETALFEANLAQASAQPALAPALLVKCQHSVLARRDAAFTLRFLEALQNSPALEEDSGFQNSLAYHRILLDQTAPLDFLRQHGSASPENLATVATLALAKLKAGRAEDAKTLFDSSLPNVDVRSLPPRLLALFVATLAANGKSGLARSVANLLPPAALSSQETDFLNGYLKAAN